MSGSDFLDDKPASPAGGTPDAAARTLEARLGDLLSEREMITAGRVQLLGLDSVRRHFGEAWPRVADKARMLIEQSIRRRIGRNDILSDLGDLNYVLLFPTLSRGQAQVKCRLIADDIARKLLGDASLRDHVSVQSVTVEVERDKIALENVSLAGALSGLLEEEAAREAASRSVAPVAPVEAGIQRQRQIEQELAELARSVRFGFRPLWFVSRNVLSTYLCIPSRRVANGQRTGHGVLEFEELRLTFALDLMVLNRCLKTLEDMKRSGRQFLLTCPVHFETLAGIATRQEYLKHCDRLPEVQRQYLVFEIVGLPENVPQSRALELVWLLRSRGRAISVRRPVFVRALESFRGTGIFAIGCDAREWTGSETRLMRHMDGFTAAAARTGLKTYIHGLRTMSMTTAAVCAGFDYVHSDLVLGEVAMPDDIHRFTHTDLFRRPPGATC